MSIYLDENDTLQTKLYRKSEKVVYNNYRLAIMPKSQKISTLSGEIHRTNYCCSNEKHLNISLKKLYLLIDKFTEFDLHPDKIDNHKMGSLYEELLRKFSEMSNEESGDHFTPRDIVKLLVSLVFGGDKENLKGEDKIRSVYDPCCGTGGMLTMGK